MADWLRKELNFDETEAKILIEKEFNGRRLLRIPSFQELKSCGLSVGATYDLWAEIELRKKPQETLVSSRGPNTTSLESDFASTILGTAGV